MHTLSPEGRWEIKHSWTGNNLPFFFSPFPYWYAHIGNKLSQLIPQQLRHIKGTTIDRKIWESFPVFLPRSTFPNFVLRYALDSSGHRWWHSLTSWVTQAVCARINPSKYPLQQDAGRFNTWVVPGLERPGVVWKEAVCVFWRVAGPPPRVPRTAMPGTD